MRTAVLVVTLLGGLLPLAAVGWAALATTRAYRSLDDDLQRIHAISHQHGSDPAKATPLMAAVRGPTSTNTTVLYQLEETRRAILRDTIDDLRGPAALAAVGVVFATVGSVWSLYL